MKKIIPTENGKITITRNGAGISIEYKQAEWSNGEEVPCFKYRDDYIFLSEVVKPDPSGLFSEYDGILAFTYFSGILIKLNESGDAVQVHYFHGG